MTAAIIKRTFDIVYGAKEIRRTASVRTVNSFLIALGIVAAMVLLGAMMNNGPGNDPGNFGIGPLPPIGIDTWQSEEKSIGAPEAPGQPETEIVDDILQTEINPEDAIPEPVDDELFDEIEQIEEEVFNERPFDEHPLKSSQNSSQSASGRSANQLGSGGVSGGGDSPIEGPSGPGTDRETVDELINKPNQVGIYDDPPVINLDELQRRVKFPHFASLRELEGNVIVRALIDIDGSVRRVVVLQADHEVFVKSAVEAVYDVKATPAYLDRKPVACWVSIPIRFRLR